MELVRWKELSTYFAKKRGVGFNYRTLQEWRTIGLPHICEDGLYFYNPKVCWQWYLDHFSVEKVI